MEQIEYGYINEDGYLRTRVLEPIEEKYKDKVTGEMKSRTVTIEEQVAKLEDFWKPVDKVDPAQLNSDNPDFTVSIQPYDNGDRISYRYEKVFNNGEIQRLKDELREEDYKIVKCYEASLTGQELPYDINALTTERQAKRDRINELETKQRLYRDM